MNKPYVQHLLKAKTGLDMMENTHLQLLPLSYNFYKWKSENQCIYEMEKAHQQLLPYVTIFTSGILQAKKRKPMYI